jgi:thiol:disulfide interchange protein
VLGAILSLIALKRDIAYGAISLFLFSLGYGTILIILGTFSSLIRKLPKQGAWLLMVKKGMGVVLIIFAGYFFLKLKESLLP